jgi:hypothetical protein
MITRLILLCLILVVAVVAPTAVLVVCALAYALRYTAYELIFIAAAIDAYYGLGGMTLPYYTFCTCAALILIEWVKPFISVYNQ